MKRSYFTSAILTGIVSLCFARTKALAKAVTEATSSLPQRLVDAFDATFKGPHPGFRANHAKGFVCTGSFVPTPAARKISAANHFQTSSKTFVRFSDFGGYPTVPDNSDGASPYGIAVKFSLPGTETDIVGHSSDRFPTATAEEFVGFLAALGGGSVTMQPYLEMHPKALEFVKSLRSSPASYATISYHFINAFRFVDDSGKTRNVRYEMRAREPQAFLSPAEAKSKDAGYLRQEMSARLKRGPVLFDYVAHVAGPGDITSDPTAYWPADREQIILGTLSVDSIAPNSDSLQRTMLFDPARLTRGIELSDDPMVATRSQSYAISRARRSG